MKRATQHPIEWRRRGRAAAIHLASCLAVATLVAALVLIVWYPWPYRIISGGDQLLFLVMGVDIVMGPLLTLAIFDVRKPLRELKRDLLIIVVLQVAALGYGLHTVYLARPVALALEGERFRVSTAVQVVKEELPRAPAGLQSLPLDGPRLIATNMPTSAQQGDAVFMALSGTDIGARPSFWRKWDASARAQALKAGRPLSKFFKGSTYPLPVQEAVVRTGRPAEQLLAVPMVARRLDWSVLIDKRTGDPVGFAPLDSF